MEELNEKVKKETPYVYPDMSFYPGSPQYSSQAPDALGEVSEKATVIKRRRGRAKKIVQDSFLPPIRKEDENDGSIAKAPSTRGGRGSRGSGLGRGRGRGRPAAQQEGGQFEQGSMQVQNPF